MSFAPAQELLQSLSTPATVLQTGRNLTDTMSKRKYLLATARLLMPATGLSLICVGAYIKSIENEELETLVDVFAYILIILGLILLVLGVLWSVGHGVKNVLVKWSGRRTQNNDVHVFTVDRPCIFPPSYEESEVRDDVEEGTVRRWQGLAPPMYTESSVETCTEDFSHEEPPTYQQAVLHSQAAPQTTCLPTNSSVEPL
ncbi:transmembrane protein 252-like [Colossoma macropomum]|uniref:transmembrane protein 252-like n=1 Tax=Colossoma macropomum TaxID=42526 RepID=UPI001863E178|nr:transmembrane protein 252-like [Colossoma macropomum]